MSSAIHSILIAGATGSVGAPILSALLAEPTFKVTILSRETSTARFPPNVPVIKISEDYILSELTAAFKDQDAVISALSTTPVTRDEGASGLSYRLIDAALAAGVKRFIPSEFGASNLDPRPRGLVPVYDRKGAMLEYLIAACSSLANTHGMTWTSISCGSWLDWALGPKASGNFLGIDVAKRTARIYDSGRSRFAVATSHNAGLAVAKALSNADLTANRQVFLSDFTTSAMSVVEELQRQTGRKYDLEWKDGAPEIARLQEQFDAGDFNATYGLLALSFSADVDVGYDFETEQQLWNARLGLPRVRLEQVVVDAIQLAKSFP